MPPLPKIKIALAFFVLLIGGGAFIVHQGSWSKKIVPLGGRLTRETPLPVPPQQLPLSPITSLTEGASSIAAPLSSQPSDTSADSEIESLVNPILDAILQSPDTFTSAEGVLDTKKIDSLVTENISSISFEDDISALITNENAVTIQTTPDNSVAAKRAFVETFKQEPFPSLAQEIESSFDSYNPGSTENQRAILLTLVATYNTLLKKMAEVPVPSDWELLYRRQVAALMTQRNAYALVAHLVITNPLKLTTGLRLLQEGMRSYGAAETELRERARAEGAL